MSEVITTDGQNYGTAVPAIVKWSSVMKSTLQRLHSYTLTSGAKVILGTVRAMCIGREQFGHIGNWGFIFKLGVLPSLGR